MSRNVRSSADDVNTYVSTSTAAFIERFREAFRLATVRRLDAKHYIQEDAPGEIAEAIAEFLGQV